MSTVSTLPDRNRELARQINEDDCLFCESTPDPPLSLQGAYPGAYPTYWIRVQIPALGFDQILRVIGERKGQSDSLY